LRKHRALVTTAIGTAALLTSAVVVAGPAVATPAHGARQAAAAAGPAVVVTTTTSRFGRVLVTGSGRSLYVFTGDNFPFSPKSPIQVPCTALNKGPGNLPCTAAWPPLLATGRLVARGGVRQAGLGTVTRNHVKQVTYFGHPVYRFVGDSAAGQKNGQNFAAFDGMWYLDLTTGRPAIGVSTLQTERSANGIVLSSPTATGRRTLYTLSFDGPRMTTCTGPCSALWPPLLTSARARAGAGVSRSAIGTIRRPNGSLQVTYHGHPVYMFAFDLGAGAKPGLTNGEYLIDAAASGVWYTVLPNGRPDPGTTTIRSERSADGTILSVTGGFNHAKATLYGFTADTSRVSRCNGQCAILWPPVLTKGRAKAGPGVSQSHLGTIRRADGTTQVTYFGHPLYFFALALNTGLGGDVVPAFGGIFYAVTVKGVLV
jgi:predicted lipoprotein with Yx(FWY)xxD motif